MIESNSISDVIAEESEQFNIAAAMANWDLSDVRVANRHNCPFAEKLMTFSDSCIPNATVGKESTEDVYYYLYKLNVCCFVTTSENVGVFYNIKDRELLTNFIKEM